MSDTPKTDAMMTALLWRTGETLIADVEFGNFARQLERENAALREDNHRLHRLAYDMAAEMEQHGGEQAFNSLAWYRAALAKEGKA